MTQTIRGLCDATDRVVTIVVARFNALVTDRLLQGAKDALLRSGASEDAIHVVEVPGAFELPLATRWAADRSDAVIALGCVIRGSTDHYDYVCGQASRGVMDAMMGSGTPVGFGLLTCDTMEQALDRAGGKLGNKGADAVHAALEMLSVGDQLEAE